MLIITSHKGNENQNHTKIPSHSSSNHHLMIRMLPSKTPLTTNAREDLGKKELSYTASGNVS
jgi:hypothetical protein